MWRRWLIGMAALGLWGCGDDTAGPKPIFQGEPQAGTAGSSGAAAAPPGLSPDSWTECSRIPAQSDPIDYILPLGTKGVAAVTRAKQVLVYVGTEPPRALPDSLASFGALPVFSPDGALLAEAIAGTVRLGSVDDGQVLRDVTIPSDCGTQTWFPPDGAHLLVAGASVCVIDLATYAVTALPLGTSKIFAFNGSEIITQEGLTYTPINLAGQTGPATTLNINLQTTTAAVLSPAGDRVAVASDTGYQLIDRATGGVVVDLPAASAGHGQQPLFSEGGAYVVIGGKVFSSADGKQTGDVSLVVSDPLWLSVDGKTLAKSVQADFAESHFELVDVASHKPVGAFGGHARSVLGVSVSPDGRRFATTNGYVVVSWLLADDFKLSAPAWAAQTGVDMYSQFSADGSLFAVSGDGRELFTADGLPLLYPPPPANVGNCGSAHFAFSPDGRYVAGGGYDFLVDVYDTATQKLVTRLPSSSCNSTAAFSPDGTFLITSALETYRVNDWSLVEPAQVSPRPVSYAENDGMSGAIFAPNGRQLLVSTCSASELAPYVWHCQHVLTPIGPVAQGRTLLYGGPRPSFSPDGGNVVAGAEVVQVEYFKEHALGARDELVSAAFTPRGDIIAGAMDGSLVKYCRP